MIKFVQFQFDILKNEAGHSIRMVTALGDDGKIYQRSLEGPFEWNYVRGVEEQKEWLQNIKAKAENPKMTMPPKPITRMWEKE